LIVTGNEDESYNGQYVRANDWNDSPHFIMGDKHLFYYPHDWSNGGWWQFDDIDQEIEGFGDFYAGGYGFGEDLVGDLSEINDDCIDFGYEYMICFALVSEELTEETVAAELYPSIAAEYVIVSEHVEESYNGQYVRANDWYDHPHFVMNDKHLFFLPNEYSGAGYWQLDDSDQELIGFSDLYNGGYTYWVDGELSELNECYDW